MIRYRIKLTIRNTYSAHPQRGSSMGLGTLPTSKSRQSLAVDIACTVRSNNTGTEAVLFHLV